MPIGFRANILLSIHSHPRMHPKVGDVDTEVENIRPKVRDVHSKPLDGAGDGVHGGGCHRAHQGSQQGPNNHPE